MSTTADNGLTQHGDDDLLGAYGTDPTLEQDGVWSNEFKGGVEMKLRSSQSKEVKAVLKRIQKRNERYTRTKQDVPEPLQKKNDRELVCAIVADWRHRTMVNGQEIVTATIVVGGEALPCTEETKAHVFGNDRLWSLRQDIIAQMMMTDRFQQEEIEADLKNSLGVSGRSSPSGTTPTV